MPSDPKSLPDGSKSSGRKPGRPPTPVPQQLAEEAIAWLEQGKTLAEWCRLPGKVERSTVHRWMDKDEQFAQRLARARDRACIREHYTAHTHTHMRGATLASKIHARTHRHDHTHVHAHAWYTTGFAS